MDLQESQKIIKALAESSRISILNALLEKPHCVEELAERLKLAVSTVSFHMKKLEIAQLVDRHKDQYYAVYSANLGIMEMTLGELICVNDPKILEQTKRLDKYRIGVIRAFIKQGRLTHLPVQKKKRMIILEEILSHFKAEKKYTEKEVNEIIQKIYSDFCTIRREFICEKMMARDQQIYWIISEGKHEMKNQQMKIKTTKEELKKRIQTQSS